LSTNFLDIGYGISWLDQALPPFTSRGFTLLPFEAVDETDMSSNTTLTAKTMLYGTNLNCYPPTKIQSESPLSLSFDNGKGCNGADIVQYSATPGKDFAAYYIGYWDNGNVDASLQFAGCGSNASHTFLAVWMRSGSQTFQPNFHNASNATALFCETSYYSQEVEATVRLPEYTVVKTTPVGPKGSLPDDAFNSTLFEYVLGAGVGPHTYEDSGPQKNAIVRQDIPDGSVIHQDAQLSNMSLLLPTSNMVGFAIGLSHLATSDYLDAQNLETSFQAAHQLLFALAARSIMKPFGDGNMSAVALRERRSDAVVMVRAFTILVEGFLAVIVLLTSYLAYHYSRRRTGLARDPNSIQEIMKLSKNKEILDIFSSCDRMDNVELKTSIHHGMFRLIRDDSTTSSLVQVCHGNDAWDSARSGPGSIKSRQGSTMSRGPTENLNSQQPLALSWPVGAVFIIFLGTAVATIVALRFKIVAQDGKPDQNSQTSTTNSRHMQVFRFHRKVQSFSNSY
jgi:hypothetical protein